MKIEDIRAFSKEVTTLERSWDRLSILKDRYITHALETDQTKRRLYTIATICACIALASGIGAFYASTIYGTYSLVLLAARVTVLLSSSAALITLLWGWGIAKNQKTVLQTLELCKTQSQALKTFSPEETIETLLRLMIGISYGELHKKALASDKNTDRNPSFPRLNQESRSIQKISAAGKECIVFNTLSTIDPLNDLLQTKQDRSYTYTTGQNDLLKENYLFIFPKEWSQPDNMDNLQSHLISMLAFKAHNPDQVFLSSPSSLEKQITELAAQNQSLEMLLQKTCSIFVKALSDLFNIESFKVRPGTIDHVSVSELEGKPEYVYYNHARYPSSPITYTPNSETMLPTNIRDLDSSYFFTNISEELLRQLPKTLIHSSIAPMADEERNDSTFGVPLYPGYIGKNRNEAYAHILGDKPYIRWQVTQEKMQQVKGSLDWAQNQAQ